MKTLKKVFAMIMTLAMALCLSIPAFAQTQSAGTGSGSIEITNPAKGVTYSVYKVFDATYSSNGSIAYTVMSGKTGVPTGFSVDSAGNVSYTGSGANGSLTDADITAIASYIQGDTAVTSATSDGTTPLTFSGLEYGYYYVTSGQGSAVTINSTNPKATIIDKNSTTPVGGLKKDADSDNVNIGDTVTYTVEFTTANYDGAKQIKSYIIKDNLPDFLEDVTVTSITVGGAAITTQQFSNKTITIPWVDTTTGESLYANGAKIVITYTAKVGDKAAIAGTGNSNTVTVTYTTDDGEKTPDSNTSTETIKTYAIAIQKVDDKGNALAGASFSISGIQTTGSDGVYTVTGKTAAGETDTVMSTDSNGILIVKGLKSGTAVSVTEQAAPAGYNKLTTPVSVTPVASTETTTNKTTYIDEDGNVTESTTETSVVYTNNNLQATVAVVVNMTGSTLPSTGGIGTTIFYVIGGLLVAGAAIALIVRKRMSNYEA